MRLIDAIIQPKSLTNYILIIKKITYRKDFYYE